MILLIWSFWMIWLIKLNYPNYVFRLNQIFWSSKFYQKYVSSGQVSLQVCHNIFRLKILHQSHNISWLQISWDISQEPRYFMVADFTRYYTRFKISHGCIFCEIFKAGPQYLIIADLRYYTRTTISHSCRCYEILNQNHNISWYRFHQISHQNHYIS